MTGRKNMKPVDTWIREHSVWLGDRHYDSIIIIGRAGSHTYQNYYQILVDPKASASEFIAAEDMKSLFSDNYVLKIYTK